MRFLLLIFLSIGLFRCEAQLVKGRIVHGLSKEPLAFVTVVEEGTQNGTFSDIDGYFSLQLQQSDKSILFSSLGFEPLALHYENKGEAWVVRLMPKAISIREVVILPGENPAETIMKKVLANKAGNDPEKSQAFTYDSYNKLVLTGERDSSRKPSVNSDSTLFFTLAGEKDSTGKQGSRGSTSGDMQKEKEDFLKDKHLFLLESVTQRRHLPPEKDEETILATRVSGLKNPTFALLGTQLQSFSLYGDYVKILDQLYLSPLHSAAISKYLFILEDTTFLDKDTIYTITFQPRKNKNFTALKGTLFICQDKWALQQVIAVPADTAASVSIRIQQQYARTEGRWFPDQLNSYLSFNNSFVNDAKVIGISRSYIRNINLQPALRNRDFGPVVLRMEPKATSVPDSVWNTYRERPLDTKELNTYVFIDSIGKAENFERRLKVFSMLGSGRIPIGPVSLDMDKLIRVNVYEGIRLGAGLHTNDFLSEKFSIGGYYGYGFRDKADKYGGDLLVHLKRKRNAWLQLSYSEDVKETGGNQLDPKPIGFLSSNYYPILVNRMDRIEEYSARVNGRIVGNLSAQLFIQQQSIRSFEGTGLIEQRSENIAVIVRNFQVQQAGIQLRWAPGEKLAVAGEREVSLGSKWPVLYLRYSAGDVQELQEPSVFHRYDFMAEKIFRTSLYGDFTIRGLVGHLPYALPGSMYYNPRGSNTIDFDKNRYIGIAAPFTFETMRVNEFMHSSFAALHLRHSFRDLLFKSKKFKPQLSIVQNMLWGELRRPDLQLRDYKAAQKGFFESGISIDRLIHNKFSAYGIAVFYRYGTYSFEEQEKNLAVKLSATFSL